MPSLLIVKNQKDEDLNSPEFSYLLSYCLKEARTLFNTEIITWQVGDPIPQIPNTDMVLIFGKENIFLSAESLNRMSSIISDSIDIVIPQLLSSFKTAQSSNIYTLKDFERVEKKIFNKSSKPISNNTNHLPVSLMNHKTFISLVDKSSFEEVLTNKSLLDSKSSDYKVSSSGIFHQFIDYYAEPREDVLPLIPENVEDVLEIGCGRGVTGKIIQEKFNCRVTGVELNPEVIEDASMNLWKIIHGDIQKIDVPGKYDVVLATELFEHLNYPEDFLIKMNKVLKPGGKIILSTPNVGHYSVVGDLIEGRWDYVPIGLLCYTHFRFFTHKTLEDWFGRLGITEYQIIPQKTELPKKFYLFPGANIESLSTKGFYLIINAR